MKKTKLTTLVAAIALMATSSGAFANMHGRADHKMKDRQAECSQNEDCHYNDFKMGLFEGITLTEEQKLKIKEYKEEAFNNKNLNHRSNMRTMFSMHKEIKDLAFSDDYSEKKVKEIVGKYTNEIADKIEFQASIENKIFNVLTNDQKIIYKKNLDKFEQQVKENRFYKKMRTEAVGADGTIYTKENIIR